MAALPEEGTHTKPKKKTEAPSGTLRVASGMADAVSYVAGGKISFYGNKAAYEAVCSNPCHGPPGSCNMTRTARGRMKQGAETKVAGRPLGFLALWLEKGSQVSSKEAHRNKDSLQAFTHAERLAARVKLLETASGRDLSTHERAQQQDEGIEPETMQGYV
eukprot:6482145-Amphidinium_carterae.1